jgi:ketosteroid isomerase-like protein
VICALQCPAKFAEIIICSILKKKIMNRFTLCLFILLFFYNNSFCQSDSLQRQVNEQVWKPFIKSFNTGDEDGFRAVHSKDIIRVSQDDNRIMGYDEYFMKVPDSVKANWKAWEKNIELRFIQRIAADGKAFEVGFYKTSSVNTSTGEKRTGYGKFHVLLRKENDTWKILMDADANEKTNEAVFLTGKPME